MRGWVCRLQLLLALASAIIFMSDSRGTRDHILLSQIRDFPFRRLLRLARLRWRYSTPPSQGSLRKYPGSPNCLPYNHFQRTEWKTQFATVSIVVCVYAAAGTCLPIRFLERDCIKPLFIRLLHNNGCTRYNRSQVCRLCANSSGVEQ
jgi:hypothetical protein